MNRLTNAFTSAIPGSGSGSDASSLYHFRDSPRVSSPLDPSFSSSSGIQLRGAVSERGRKREPSESGLQHERRYNAPNPIYDDPRTIYHPSSSYSSSSFGNSAYSSNSGFAYLGGSLNRPSRPGLLRHLTDDGGATTRGASTPRARSTSATRERDKGVRVNLMAASSGSQRRVWGMTAAGTTRLSAMAQGPEGKYAVGGGQYLRVFQIFNPTSGDTTPLLAPEERKAPLAKGPGGVSVSEVVNLWKSSWPVGKGVNDVTWGVGAFEHKIATATPSGYMLMFDVERGKLDKEVASGTRPMNCVRFCPIPAYGHMTIAGGTDGAVRVLDMRDSAPSMRKPLKHSSSVTSLCFSPHSTYSFVVGIEDGSIWRYDFRVLGKLAGKAYGAHGNKAVMDLKWKESEDTENGRGGWLASAGADKVVQIWDMSQSWDEPPSPTHTLHTAHPIRRIAWRPNHSSELMVVPLPQSVQLSTVIDPSKSPDPDANSSPSSSAPTPGSIDDDSHLEIWHARRHHVAKYAIPTMGGGAVDIAWSDGDDSLVACFQNGGFAQINVNGRLGVGSMPLPLDAIPRQVVGWSPRGEIVYAVDRFKPGEVPFDDIKREYANHWDKVGRQPSSIADPAYESLQTIGTLSMPDGDEAEFAYLANWYKVEGAEPAVLCQWNEDVAKSIGRDDDARLWSFLRLLIEEFAPPESLRNFDEDIFTQPLASTERLATPLDISPTASGQRTPGKANRSRSRSRPRASRSIPLERVNDIVGEDESDKRSDTSRSSSSSSSSRSYSDSESDDDGSQTPARSRFVAFAPPDADALATVQRAAEGRQASVATTTPRLASSSRQDRRSSSSSSEGSSSEDQIHSQSQSQVLSSKRGSGDTASTERNKPRTASGSGGGGPSQNTSTNSAMRGASSVRSTSDSKKSKGSLSKMTASRILAASDWPDPYGITTESTPASTSTSASTSATPQNRSGESNRSSPIPALLNGETRMKSSPQPAQSSSLIPRRGSGTNRAKEGDALNEQDRGRDEKSGPAMAVAVQSPLRGREEKFEKRDWEEYKARRVRGLMKWWESCVDNGELQLATAILLVASCIASFPAGQSERIAHAYVDMLERHRLAVAAAYTRLQSHIPSLEITAHDEGMTHLHHCERCGKSTGSLEDIGVDGKVFWWCRRCKAGARSCAVCRRTVQGVWLGCRNCTHGGHPKCMNLYYSQAPFLSRAHTPNLNPNQQKAQNPTTTGLHRVHSLSHGHKLAPAAAAAGGSGFSSVSLSSTDVSTSIPTGTSLEERERERDHRRPPSVLEGMSGVSATAGVSGVSGLSGLSSLAGSGGGGAGATGGWTMCPTGCGCRCRRALPDVPA